MTEIVPVKRVFLARVCVSVRDPVCACMEEGETEGEMEREVQEVESEEYANVWV